MTGIRPKTISGLEIVDWEGRQPGYGVDTTKNIFNQADNEQTTALRPIATDVPVSLVPHFQSLGINRFLEQVDDELEVAAEAVSQILPCRVVDYEWTILNLVVNPIPVPEPKDIGREFCDTFSLNRYFCLGAVVGRINGTNYLKSPTLTTENYKQSLKIVSALREARSMAAKEKGWFIYDIYRLAQFMIDHDGELVLVDIEPHINSLQQLNSWPMKSLDEEDDDDLANVHGVEIEIE